MEISSVIAIDGPSGSGKSTVAKKVAEKLNYIYIDTGAMFRALAVYLDGLNIPHDSESEIDSCLGKLNIQYGESSEKLIILDDENLTTRIREHYVSDLASKYSKNPAIRKYLLQKQRDLAKDHSCVMEGRDIGTVVFPNAYLKIFLTASPQERAQRRYLELQSRGSSNLSLENILEDIERRDERDKSREQAPLVQAEDATMIVTDGQTVDEIVNTIEQLSVSRRKEVGI